MQYILRCIRQRSFFCPTNISAQAACLSKQTSRQSLRRSDQAIRHTSVFFFNRRMAFKTLKAISFLSHRNLRYFSLVSTLPVSQLSEKSLLDQLSNFLPISSNPIPNPNPNYTEFSQKSNQNDAYRIPIRDRVLSPAEKLRNVFILNLKGTSAVESALSTASVDLTVEIFREVISEGNLNGECVISFFNWAIKQPQMEKCVDNYNIVVKLLGRRKFFSYMEEFMIRMRQDGVDYNLDTVEVVIDSFVRARRISKAIEFYDNVGRGYVGSFNALITCLGCRSHVKVATSLFNSKRGNILFDCTTYNEIIKGWAKLGRIDMVDRFMDMMISDGFNHDNITLSCKIEALGRAKRINDALDLFNKMKEMGCQPCVMSYNTMIFNYVCVGELDKAIKYYKCMSGEKCLPSIYTYDMLINALLKARRVADALEIFDEMISLGVLPTTGMITSFLEPLCRFGPPHAAMIIYTKSRNLGCIISMKAYKLLLMRLSRFGKSGMVLKIWEEMQDSGYTSDKEVYEYIINGLCNVGHVDNAVCVVEEALRKGYCIGKIVYSKLNSKLAEMNKVETAYKLFLKVKGVRDCANSRSFWRANGWHF